MDFSYQGKEHVLSVGIDLDKMMEQSGSLPDFHRFLARENNIDTHSYLYEVMESYEVIFENASGLAVKCLSEGKFDLQAFEKLWHQEKVLEILQEIATTNLGVSNLEQESKLKAALLAAYNAGQSAKRH